MQTSPFGRRTQRSQLYIASVATVATGRRLETVRSVSILLELYANSSISACLVSFEFGATGIGL